MASFVNLLEVTLWWRWS